jgi:hypothetical protein
MLTGAPADDTDPAQNRLHDVTTCDLFSRSLDLHWVQVPMGTNPAQHIHVAVVTHLIRQRQGIPYEMERKVCAACARVLGEKPVKRLTAA